jgi:hypothetical protein
MGRGGGKAPLSHPPHTVPNRCEGNPIKPLGECHLGPKKVEGRKVFRIHRIHVFLGLPDPDPNPLVRGMDPDPALDPDPDPSLIKQIQ